MTPLLAVLGLAADHAAAPDDSVLAPLLDECNPGLRAAIVDVWRTADTRNVADAVGFVATYRLQKGKYDHVCLQVYREPSADTEPILNPGGVVHDRLGSQYARAAEDWLALLYAPVRYLGDAQTVAAQERAIQFTFHGDVTLLREQTVEPLYVLAVIPDAAPLMPTSLRGRVQRVVGRARLSFTEWDGTTELVAPDAATANQVGDLVRGVRDLASALAITYANGGEGLQLQSALKESKVTVDGNRVRARLLLPAAAVVRISRELTGHAPPEKVAICHRGHTIYVSQTAVSSHLAHGDTRGPCAGEDGRTTYGNNGLGNGPDPQPPGNPPPNDVPGI